jgi:hypothetical protein
MVPENPHIPEHLSATIEQLTPETRPPELTDPVWKLIVRCYQKPRDYYFTYMDIWECLDRGECSIAPDRNGNEVELPWVLFVRSRQWVWPDPQNVS